MNEATTWQRIVKAFHWARWGQHLAVAGAYGAAYELTLPLSFPQWILTAGLRLACMLLLPVRFGRR